MFVVASNSGGYRTGEVSFAVNNRQPPDELSWTNPDSTEMLKKETQGSERRWTSNKEKEKYYDELAIKLDCAEQKGWKSPKGCRLPRLYPKE